MIVLKIPTMTRHFIRTVIITHVVGVTIEVAVTGALAMGAVHTGHLMWSIIMSIVLKGAVGKATPLIVMEKYPDV